MPWREEIRKFDAKNGNFINLVRIGTYATGVGYDNNPLEGDKKIAEHIKRNFMYDARRHEIFRQQQMMLSAAKPGNKKLKKAVEEMADSKQYLDKFIDAYRRAAGFEALKRHQVEYKNLPRFGITGKEFTDLMKEQMSGYRYEDGRKFEIFKAYGIKNPRFINQAAEVDGFDYNTATEEQKEAAHRTYITKKLVEAEYKTWGRFWKFLFRSEAKAMEAYIAKANEVLDNVKFPAEGRDALVAATADKGFALSDPESKVKLDELFAETERTVDERLAKDMPERQKMIDEANEKVRLQAENEEKAKAEQRKIYGEKIAKDKDALYAEHGEKITAANAKENVRDAFFQIRFRPSFDLATFNKQKEALKDTMKYVHGKGVSAATKTAFKITVDKIATVNNYFKSIEAIEDLSDSERQIRENEIEINFFDIEKNVSERELSDYKAPTFQEVKEGFELSKQLGKEMLDKAFIQTEPEVKEAPKQPTKDFSNVK